MTDFLIRATQLVARGFSVIPLTPSGKAPIPGGPGALSRTKEAGQVAQWAAKWPTANAAVCADENVVILETDNLEQLNRVLLNGCGRSLSEVTTLMAAGSSENRPHLFFKRTEKATHVGNLVVPNLFEARFSNQYVVGPGSTHPSGAVYRWLNDNDMVSIPDWLVSELARLALSQKNSPDSGPRQILETAGKVAEGSRHYYLMRELGRAWDGRISEEELTEKAFELNAQCDPPKDSSHVLQCVRDIMRRDPYDPGPTVVIGTDEKKTLGQGWESISAEALCSQELPPRNAVMKEKDSVLFYEGSINQILAWRGVGKTCFALSLAGAVATGGGLLDFSVDRPRRVLYIDGELPKAQLQERVRQLMPVEHRELVQLFGPEFLPQPRGLNLLTNGDFNSLLGLIEKNKTEVLFIDSQSTTMAGDSNKTEFQEARQQVLMQLRWMGVTVVEMHHVGKEGRQRGLSRNDDILDVQMHLKRTPDWEPEDGLQFEIVYEKVRHASKLQTGYVVTMTDGQWSTRPADEVTAAAEMFNNGASLMDVAKKLKCSKGKAHNLRRKADKADLLKSAIRVGAA